MISAVVKEFKIFVFYNVKAMLFIILSAAFAEGSHRELPSLKVVRSASVKVWLNLVCLMSTICLLLLD